MPKQIQVDNQIIEFPDNMPDNEIEAVIKREFYNQPQTTSQPIPEPIPQEQPKMSGFEAFATTATNVPFAPRINSHPVEWYFMAKTLSEPRLDVSNFTTVSIVKSSTI